MNDAKRGKSRRCTSAIGKTWFMWKRDMVGSTGIEYEPIGHPSETISGVWL